jgi:hypothetical protein
MWRHSASNEKEWQVSGDRVRFEARRDLLGQRLAERDGRRSGPARRKPSERYGEVVDREACGFPFQGDERRVGVGGTETVPPLSFAGDPRPLLRHLLLS